MQNKPYLKLTDLKQLPSVAFTNVQALRQLAAKSRQLRDFRYANQVEHQVVKWERVWKRGTKQGGR